MQIFNLFKVITILCGILNIVSGSISWNNGPDGPWALNCDFFGNDLSNVASRGEECSGKCKQTTGCTHYTWSNFNGGTCWMKRGSISQSNAKNANGLVCGIVDFQGFIHFRYVVLRLFLVVNLINFFIF
jgi:hypothetical protein